MIAFRVFRILIDGVLGFFSALGAKASFEPTAIGSFRGGWLIFYLGLLVAALSGITFDIRRIIRSRRVSRPAPPASKY